MTQWQPKPRTREKKPQGSGPLFLILLALFGLGLGAVLTFAVITFSGESLPSVDLPSIPGLSGVSEEVTSMGEAVGGFVETMQGHIENQREFTSGQFGNQAENLGRVADPGKSAPRD